MSHWLTKRESPKLLKEAKLTSRADTSLSTEPKPNKKENAPRERTLENLEIFPTEETTLEPENHQADPNNPELMSPEKNPTPSS
jgi:hypothetical protein